MVKYTKGWFDKLGIDNTEFVDNVGLHVFAKRHNCQLFQVPQDFFNSPDLWENIRAMAEERWAKPRTVDNRTCHVCGMPISTWGRLYLGRRFCGRCGTDYHGTWSR